MTKATRIEPTQRLLGIHRERRARRRRGETAYVAYVSLDRDGEYMLVSQKLAAIAAFINEQVAADDTKAHRASFQGMYDMVDARGRANDAWYKGRWRTVSLGLRAARDAVEEAKGRFRNVVALGSPECFEIAPLHAEPAIDTWLSS